MTKVKVIRGFHEGKEGYLTDIWAGNNSVGELEVGVSIDLGDGSFIVLPLTDLDYK